MDFSQIPKIEIVKFENLSFSFGPHEPLLTKVDFNFPTNKVVWIKAQSGAGRSTLLQILAGLQMPNEGKYVLNDVNITDLSFEEFVGYRLAIGYSFDFGGLINNRTLLDNLTLPLLYHKLVSAEEAKDRAEVYMKELGILKFKDQRPAMVSASVRKATCLIRSIIMHPQLLLLDDPSVGLPQEQFFKFFDIVQKLRDQGHIKHVYVSSYDEKIMSCIEHEDIYLDNMYLYSNSDSPIKKVVSL